MASSMNRNGKLTSILTRLPVDSKQLNIYARSKKIDTGELLRLAFLYHKLKEDKFPDISLLHLACAGCKPDVIAILLKEGWEVNKESPESGSPLHVALDVGNNSVGRLLIESGADFNHRSYANITPMGVALSTNKRQKSCVSAVKLLLEAGVSVNAIVDYDDHDTALHVAVANNLPIVVSLLLQHEADINVVNLKHITPLLYAVYHKHVDVVKLLLLHRPDLYKEDVLRNTPMIEAVKQKHKDLIEIFVNAGYDINRSIKGNLINPLHTATVMCDLEIVKLLLSLNADPNKTVCGKITPLHIISKCPPTGFVFGNQVNVDINVPKDIAEALINRGARLNSLDDDTQTPLQVSMQSGWFSVAKLLITSGADISVCSSSTYGKDSGCSLFHQAVVMNRDIITSFLENGADFNVCDIKGMTPYHFGILHSIDLKFIKRFLLYGCPYNQNPSAWAIVLKTSSQDTQQFFTAQKRFFKGLEENNLNLVKAAVEQGAVPSSTSEEIRYPLHLLAFKGYTKILTYLLENNVPPNTLNELGQTALFIAAKYGHLDICYSLLNHGASFNYTCISCAQTPLIAANHYNHKQISDLLSGVNKMFKLCEIGSKCLIRELHLKIDMTDSKGFMYINVVDKRGDSLLSTAIRNNHKYLIENLIKFHL